MAGDGWAGGGEFIYREGKVGCIASIKALMS